MAGKKRVTLAVVRRLRAQAAAIDPATQYLPWVVLADWLDERGIDGSPLRLPLKKHTFTVSGEFHGTSATIIADVLEETERYVMVCVSRSQVKRANKSLCGIRSCECGDRFVPDDGRDLFYDDREEFFEHRIRKD